VSDYPFIEDHGLIGDLQTAALVTNDGTIDWFCAPRFDSPSIFASLLDHRHGGRFRIAPRGTDWRSTQLYFPDSAILITRFMAEDAVAELIDFMPVEGDPTVATENHRIIRVVHGLRGHMDFRLDCEPRFDYARHSHQVSLTSDGAVFTSPERDLTLSVNPAMRLGRSGEVDVRAEFSVDAGQLQGCRLETAASSGPRPVSQAEDLQLFEETVGYWRQWLNRGTYEGRWREMVHRSAMTLKLMTYAPTGGMVAAITTGLPEQIGGERNWDYRFTWVRDSSFSIYALLGLGYTEAAYGFLQWLNQRVVEHAGEDSGPLKIMYRIDGSSDLTEETLDHFEGYMGSSPVRIGNGASDQLQLDIYGEAMDSIYLADHHIEPVSLQAWTELTHILDWLADNWNQPDEGVWETRGGRKDFTYGRLMCWVAFDRAVRMAYERGRPGEVDRWGRAREAIYHQIMKRGWNAKRGAFTQHPETSVLDASNLLMPLVGFIGPKDPLWLSTLSAIDEELVRDSLVYRYNPSASPDGLRGSEGTFSLCSFLYVGALARAGRLEEARYAFEKMLTYSNHVGLFSEEIAPSGHQIGNFPQAFTHLALINAAIDLDAQLNQARHTGAIRVPGFGRALAWT
jgi:GH15 family glucan-1,4-alpha-glucosidase